MPQVACAFCRLPFRVRTVREGAAYYCCSGCALAASIPVGNGQLPVSRPLLTALGLGFGVFNQVLFSALSFAVVGEGRPEVGGSLALVALAIGAFANGAALLVLGFSGSPRLTDAVAAVPAVAAALWSGWTLRDQFMPATAWLLAANLWLTAWLARGWLRKTWARKSRR